MSTLGGNAGGFDFESIAYISRHIINTSIISIYQEGGQD